MPSEYLTTEALFERTSIPKGWWEKKRLTGGGPKFLKLSGNKVMYRWRVVEEWLAAHERASTAESKAA
jgi:hypothetical protein